MERYLEYVLELMKFHLILLKAHRKAMPLSLRTTLSGKKKKKERENHTFIYGMVPFLNVTEPPCEVKNPVLSLLKETVLLSF